MKTSFPSQFQRKTLWRALTGIAILIIGLLIAGMIWLTGQVLGYLQPVLIPLAVAGITAYLLDPIVSWLQAKGLSRLKAVISVFGSFLILLTAICLIVIPPIAKQISDALQDRENIGAKVQTTMENIKDAPWLKPVVEYASEKVEPKSGLSIREVANKRASQPPTPTSNETSITKPEFQHRWQHLLSKYAGKILGTLTSWLSEGTSKILGVFGLALGFAMAPIYLYYFLKESSGIKAHWHDYVPLRASPFKTEVVDTLQEINGYLISFFRGQMLVAFIDGVLVGIALWIFGLPYGLLIGLFMAILGVIPYIGNILCLIPACIIAFVHFGHADNQNLLGTNPWLYVAAVVAIFIIVQQINSLVTAPKIVGDSVGLHPMTVIFSMLFWTLLLGGFIGAILAVPMTAALKVLFRRYVWERKLKLPLTDEAQDIPIETA